MAFSTVFTNNRTQAVRLPAEMRFPATVKKVQVRALGADRIVTPANAAWDSFFSDGLAVTPDFMAERAHQNQKSRESL